MRILMEQGGYSLYNMGDLAMLMVAVRRCRHLFPDAKISILGHDPGHIQACVPGVTPLTVISRDKVLTRGNLFGRLARYTGSLDQTLVEKMPTTLLPLVKMRHRIHGHTFSEIENFIDAISETDLVIATGGGYITDEFSSMVEGVCGILAIAQRMRKPTAMFGQGLGPLGNPALFRKAARGMKKLDLLALREAEQSLPLAHRLGVSADRCIVTGDDAIEMAYEMKSDRIGDKLGLNIRVAYYSGVAQDNIACLRTTLGKIFRALNVSPQILSISMEQNSDWKETRNLLPDDMECADPEIHQPDDIIRMIGKCRLVITGSYHAGVFALSQGIPVIGLAKSIYYRHKFDGLASQFGTGCISLNMSHTDFSKQLFDATMHMWENADRYRASLLEKAQEQMNLSRQAYQRLGELVLCRK